MPRQVLEDTLTADSVAADTALAASGDASAFERLYHTHVARVHSLVRRMLDADEADDLTQDIFVRAWQKLGTFRGESAFGTWLHRLAVNVVLARRKTLGVERGRFHGGEDPLAGVPGKRETPEISMDFEEALATLPDGARQVFVLTRRVLTLVAWTIAIIFASAWLSFVLARFPYTRPWGEQLENRLLGDRQLDLFQFERFTQGGDQEGALFRLKNAPANLHAPFRFAGHALAKRREKDNLLV